ncbi:hypothetical protein HDG35_003676 [Paraburkholderia sp. JPY681]|nr:hypothetical protein [Paraburkholderia atlantica]
MGVPVSRVRRRQLPGYASVKFAEKAYFYRLSGRRHCRKWDAANARKASPHWLRRTVYQRKKPRVFLNG